MPALALAGMAAADTPIADIRATFVFMADLPSRIALDGPLSPLLPPAADALLHIGPDGFFTGNFESLDLEAGPHGPLGETEWLRWARLRDPAGLDPMVEVLAVGDMLPPAAFKLLGKDGVPLGSLAWTINLLTPAPVTGDGWWLLSAKATHAANGGSSQTMMLWNADGAPIAQAMQSVAIFG